eukprot:3143269-Pyramimonas_sp.AAC.1
MATFPTSGSANSAPPAALPDGPLPGSLPLPAPRREARPPPSDRSDLPEERPHGHRLPATPRADRPPLHDRSGLPDERPPGPLQLAAPAAGRGGRLDPAAANAGPWRWASLP